MRAQLRMIVAGIVIIVIAAASIIEPPGTVEGIGYAIVLLAMLLVVFQEWSKSRQNP